MSSEGHSAVVASPTRPWWVGIGELAGCEPGYGRLSWVASSGAGWRALGGVKVAHFWVPLAARLAKLDVA